ncbi:IS3 family transposase [Rhodococcus sp. WS1]|uniref:IS3 family transposase n=1 Tax=unclassified Rhodococcus (in: high G+C Gram-positive bacteria) TaxID=192944 RepID=UPI001143C386|nr:MULTISPECIES: IS3 family transposase [unclassified Rhodococcus (in: high G+C Gram-positive bacteria)]ROZ52947.1 IS3 family transposase [Rhodococcus sp. WS1]TQC36037.1 IS3 family transposase [Rhodococcus sp. WS7]
MRLGTNKRYPPELRERAVRMVAEVQHEYPSEWAAVESVADRLGIGTAQTLLNWIRRAQTDVGERPGVTSEMAAEMRKLRAENRELKRANEILKSASGFLRSGARPQQQVIIDYINRYKSECGVEPMCRVLSEHGCSIAPSTYYEARNRSASRRTVRDEELKIEVIRVHAENYSVYGARKVWSEMRREGIDVARCTVERLMGVLGLEGARRGKKKRTTIADTQGRRAEDLVQRKLNPAAPNVLCVADFTYVSTWSGWVYVAFVIDAYSRRILGWRTATTMTTPLVLDAIEHAIWARRLEGITDLSGLIHHNDRGSQGGFNTSIAFTDRLIEVGIDASIGATGSSYDNALAETINGLYKTELIKPRGAWRTVEHVEIATLEWVDRFNHRRLYEHCGDVPPAELEAFYYGEHRTTRIAEFSNQ